MLFRSQAFFFITILWLQCTFTFNEIHLSVQNCANCIHHFHCSFSLSYNNLILNLFLNLISLWFPSMCQRARGECTWYCLLLIATVHLCQTPTGSVLIRDWRIRSLWTRCPWLWSRPLSIRMPMLGLLFWAAVTSSSSCSSGIWL